MNSGWKNLARNKRVATAATAAALAATMSAASWPAPAQAATPAPPNYYGSANGSPLVEPIVGTAATPNGAGYWLVAADGGVFTFGNAGFFGSTGGHPLFQPVVGMAHTGSGQGYWLVAADGGIFTFGDAHFFGSTGGHYLAAPVVGMAPTPDGGGYWLVAADGGIFAFGDARFYGSMGGKWIPQPVVGMAATSTGQGYWLVGANGSVYNFGDAADFGSPASASLSAPVVGIAATSTNHGYWLAAADGGVFTYGDAAFHGSAFGGWLTRPVVGIATSPSVGGYWVASSDGAVLTLPQPPNANHFATLPPNAALPSDAQCASAVRPAAETRPANAAANGTRGVGSNSDYPRVDGNFVGTTDAIIQWAACKWGIDENVARAQAVGESWWFQRTGGDFSTDPTTCVPGHSIGADGTPGQCPQSIGLLQVRYPYHQSAFANNNATVSTAYNIDYAYAVWRDCFDGNLTWLNQVDRGAVYGPGDLWGCLGVWFSGRWHTAAAETYISKIQGYYNQQTWTMPSFINAT